MPTGMSLVASYFTLSGLTGMTSNSHELTHTISENFISLTAQTSIVSINTFFFQVGIPGYMSVTFHVTRAI